MAFRVGFVGYKNSGKTHISSKLKSASAFVKTIGFSDPLYETVVAATGIPMEDFQNKEIRELPDPRLGGRSIQYALNTLGSEWGRKMMFEEIWTNRAFKNEEDDMINIFDNVRFTNELEGVRKGSKSVLFAIKNRDVKNDGSYPEKEIAKLQKQCDFVIDNTGQQFAMDTHAMTLFLDYLHVISANNLSIEEAAYCLHGVKYILQKF
ncbi:deoxynucleotide monophosphate kinase [Agrobacterium phage OLIVR5]|uniref:Deoxynucleotide monophosphate kinase n=1 Tax=Agrobacterium phage OLIVR5 TaxID=2723773 RepID=A0A858MTE7_9CAUD|nr:deoxynucleotide monophosphate kinase [Agrobacterium phage OLIVR5]QIW87888.1 deoxynucleotide monophosphate kinase [Agrobacterium phage OLIVR5]QIW88153.1 deoxynucleotide monophosphate kinase [Agrobacterium phage OLIVR6]